MKLVSYRQSGTVRIGAVVNDQVVHLNALLRPAQIPMTWWVSKTGELAMDAARAAVAARLEGPTSAAMGAIMRPHVGAAAEDL